jgi:hypothetical protein
MKIATLASVLLTVLAGTALAQDKVVVVEKQTPSFAIADTDKDGHLSVAELKVVLPDVAIVDLDADDYVSQAEAEAAISGLSFTVGKKTALIAEPDYDLIVATLAKDDHPQTLIVEDDDEDKDPPDVKVDVDVETAN